MSEESLEPLHMEMLAASLRADMHDTAIFLEALASKLSGSIPHLTQVTRHSSLFSRSHPVKSISIMLGEHTYTIGKEQQGQIIATRAKAVRGVVIKTDQLTVDQWINEIASGLAQEAQYNAQARSALEQMLR